MINKETYEAYFLDYIEGNLSPKDTDILLIFLDQNPDLKNELESYSDVTLTPPASYIDKASLKQVDVVNDVISTKNALHFAIANFENQISESKKEELLALALKNPSIEKEISLVSKTKLIADESIKYPEKGKLKKAIPFFFPYYKMVGIAAILLLMIYFFIPKGNTDTIYSARNIYYTPIKNQNILNRSKIEQPFITDNSSVSGQSSNSEKTIITTIAKTLDPKKIVKNEVATYTDNRVNELIPSIDARKVDEVPSFKSTRVITSFTFANATPNYYPESRLPKIDKNIYLTPKEFLTSLFKKDIIKSGNDDIDLVAEDFNNTLASLSNNKISIKKNGSDTRYISFQTKNFSFEKKISN